MRRVLAALLLSLTPAAAGAGSLDLPAVQRSLSEISSRADGRFGACVREVATGREACVRGGERFPMQNVVKLPIAVAVLAAVESRVFRLDEPILIRRSDLSVLHQPLERLVGAQGFRTTVDDLLQRMVTESDNAATDVLLGRIRGPTGVQQALDRRGVTGVRVDRNERTLQTDMLGLVWTPALADPAAFREAVDRMPEETRRARFEAYLRDPRDTATPEGMADLLARLAQGRLLGPSGTERLVAALEAAATGPDRLKAGLPPGWRLAHKTGTGGAFQGVLSAVNDAGILTAPDGGAVAVAVFLSGSSKPVAEQAALIAAVSRAAAGAYR